ncbi:MAG: hypothetical protein DRO99_05380 [Candidatus Aenigmatarchaeota archaeon]|nr:MAG: hypothetical protein DRO99_05380 [Candidatus Aenigmarchaeota archaeon]
MEKSKRPSFYKNTSENVLKIFDVLKKARDEDGSYLTVSEISRRSGLHRWTVSRTIDMYMSQFLDVVMPEELEHVGVKIKLVRLSDPGIKKDAVLRSIRIKI